MSLKRIMKLGHVIVFSAFLFDLAAQSPDQEAIREIEAKRAEQLAKFKAEGSPIPKKERKKLKSLNYFPIDLSYRLKAKFVKTETPELFKMKTTTSRLPDYRKYGEVHFTLKGVEYKLEVYQSPEVARMPGYKDHLFIPFTDKTNGNETYEVGRYIDMTIPSGEEVTLDFNLCYNPYCSYNPNYSCPIPPQANDLPIEIKAGELAFTKTTAH